MRQKANAAGRLLEHPNLRGPLEPLPLVDALAQDRAHQCQRPIYRGIAAALRELRIGDLVDCRAGDGGQVLTAKELIEPTQLGDIFPSGGLVRLLLQPPHHRLDSMSAGLLAKLPDSPQLRLQPVVKLLR